MKNQDTYIDLDFEGLLTNLYGSKGNPVHAGFTSLATLQKAFVKVFSTISKAALRNINGDDNHRNHVVDLCRISVDSIKRAKSKDELSQIAVSRSIELNFLLMGRLPRNGRKAKAGWMASVDLAQFRTLCYVRTDKQKIDQIIDDAYRQPQKDEDVPLFNRLIEIRNRHPHDDQAALRLIREEAPELYVKYN